MTIHIEKLGKSRLEQAFLIATEVFSRGSTLHAALGVELDEYRKYLQPSFASMVGEGLSVAAIDETNDHVVGCLIASDFNNHLGSDNTASGKFAPLAALTSSLCGKYREYRDISRGETVLVDMGAVSPAAAGLGIYQRMRGLAQDLAKQNGFKFVVGELSSASTQHVVLEKLGHKKVASIRFDEFVFDDQKPFQKITSPSSVILAEGKL